MSVTSQCVWMMVNTPENKIKRRKTVSPLTAFCIYHKIKGAEISLCRLFVSEAQTYNLWISTVAAVHRWVDCFNYCLWKWDQRRKNKTFCVSASLELIIFIYLSLIAKSFNTPNELDVFSFRSLSRTTWHCSFLKASRLRMNSHS